MENKTSKLREDLTANHYVHRTIITPAMKTWKISDSIVKHVMLSSLKADRDGKYLAQLAGMVTDQTAFYHRSHYPSSSQ